MTTKININANNLPFIHDVDDINEKSNEENNNGNNDQLELNEISPITPIINANESQITSQSNRCPVGGRVVSPAGGAATAGGG